MADATRTQKDLSPAVFIIVYGIAGVAVIFGSGKFRTWILTNWLPIAIAVGIAIAGLIWAAWRQQSATTGARPWRIVLVLLLAFPLVVGLVALLHVLDKKYHQSVLRGVFLVAVIFLPAILYYLFVALRRVSLLQEFFTNLMRLGLLHCRPAVTGEPAESERDRKIRVMTYLQMFEGIYGQIPDHLAGDIVRQTDQTRVTTRVPDFHKYQASLLTPEAIPVVVATVVIGLGWLLVLPPWDVQPLSLQNVLKPTPDAVLFAFLGAYFFTLQMLFRRFVRRDLRANAYVGITMRIILAVIGVWAVLQVAQISGDAATTVGKLTAAKIFVVDKGPSLLVIGFVVGAFPPVAWQVVVAFFRWATRARFFVPSLASQMPLRHLDGLTVWHEGRLEEEDIENVQNMATVNLVEFMVHTRYPPERVVDWVDQAMLITQLGNEPPHNSDDVRRGLIEPSAAIKTLRGYGIRTASSLVAAYEKSVSRGTQEDFVSILRDDKGCSRIPFIIDALRTNPNLVLVQRWNATAENGSTDAAPPSDQPSAKQKPKTP
jgi:hypothetical protein